MAEDEQKDHAGGRSQPKDVPEAGASDILAFIIAAFQLILPAAAVLFGFFWLMYKLLQWWAR